MLDVVDYTPIPTTVPDLDEDVWTDLSRDQKLLFRYCKAISTGNIPLQVAHLGYKIDDSVHKKASTFSWFESDWHLYCASVLSSLVHDEV